MKLTEITQLLESTQPSPERIWELMQALDDHLVEATKDPEYYPPDQKRWEHRSLNDVAKMHNNMHGEKFDLAGASHLLSDAEKALHHEQLMQAVSDAYNSFKLTNSGVSTHDSYSIVSIASAVDELLKHLYRVSGPLEKYNLTASDFAKQVIQLNHLAQDSAIHTQDYFGVVRVLFRWFETMCSKRFHDKLTELDKSFVRAVIKQMGLEPDLSSD